MHETFAWWAGVFLILLACGAAGAILGIASRACRPDEDSRTKSRWLIWPH